MIEFWLRRHQSKEAYALLKEHDYEHDWIKHGDLSGFSVRVSGKFFEPDEDGDFMIVQAVWDDPPSPSNWVENPILQDIICWHPEKPQQWYFLRGEAGVILGEKALFESSLFREPLTLHSTPFDWLKSGCEGSALLDHHGLNKLYGLKGVICEDIEHGTRIEKGLSMYYRTHMPQIAVPTLMENRV